MDMQHIVLYWQRRDFRLRDNPALHHASQIAQKESVLFLPFFVLEDYMTESDFGYPSKYMISHTVPSIAKEYKNFVLFKGKGARSVLSLVSYLQKHYIDATVQIHVNEDIHPDFFAQVARIRARGIDIVVHADRLTVDRETKTLAGAYYSIFTPFKKAVWKDFMAVPICKTFSDTDISYAPHSVIKDIPHTHECDTQKILHTLGTKRTCIITKKYSIDIDDFFVLPDLEQWYTTEAGAHTALKYAVGHIVEKYSDTRDSLDMDAQGSIAHPASTSRLSVALAWGLLSARQVRNAIQTAYKTVDFVDVRFLDKIIPHNYTGIVQFFSELIWREFYAYLLLHNPALIDTEFQARFRGSIHWVPDHIAKERFAAWIQGKTGYSVVDAAMRQLAQTGWMHNRSRMIVASVLTKNLGVDWRWGQAYFRAMLIDIDEASNNGGWQWGASVGADPKPIRIFNPYTQAKNYDPENAYQKKWLGETDFFFETTPIVEHALARQEALVRYGLGGIKKESIRDY